jgi:subtilisin family serine protease
VKLKSKVKNTVLAGLAGLTITACGGGGGGGVSVSFDPPPKSQLAISTNIFGVEGSGSAFLSAIQKMSEDQVIDTAEAIEAFRFVQQYNGTFDPSVLADYEITIDGRNMSLEKGWYALVGYTKKYYEGKEQFWNTLVTKREYDDEDLTFLAIEADLKKDVKNANLIDDLAETGKATITSTDTTSTLDKTETGDAVDGEIVVTHGDWTETTSSDDLSAGTRTSTEERTVTTTTSRSRTITETYIDTTVTTFSNGDTKTTKTYRTAEITETLPDLIVTNTETRTITETLTYTDTSVTDEVTATSYGDPYNGDPTYTDWSEWDTTSSTTSRTSTDLDNGDGTTTRTTRETTTYSQKKTRTKSIQAYRVKTVSYKSYTFREWAHGATEELNLTTRSAETTETYGDPVTETETETRTINDSPGQVVSTETFNNVTDTAYTENDENLGTRTVGYNTDKTTYETDEYTENGMGWAGGSGKQVNASSAYSKGWTGKGSIVAVADTGYDTDHTEFDGQVLHTKDYYGNGIQDNHGHGSHVLGTILAKKDGTGMHGMAYDAKAVVIKIGDQRSVSLDDAASGLSWAADQGAIVGNLSANRNYDSSFRGNVQSLTDGTYQAPIQYNGNNEKVVDYSNGMYVGQMTSDIWKNATDKGLVLVNSAGNQGLEYSAMPGWFATETDADGNLVLGGKVLIVGSYNFNANNLDSWTNKAGHLCRVVVDNACTDTHKTSDFYVLAPGNTYSTDNNGSYNNMSGTSMAAPIVTGQVAVLHQMWPHMKGENLVKLVTTTANKDITGYDVNIHGQGIVDFDEATKPQGAIGIPTTGRVDGGTSSISNTYATGSASVQSVLSDLQIMVIDDFDRDYYMYLGNSFTVKDNRKYSDVEMLVDNKNTFLPHLQMYGSFAQGGQWDLAKNYNFGLYTGENGVGDYSLNVGKDFYLNNKFKFKTSIGYMSEQDTWLGNTSEGVLAIGDNNDTRSVNIGVSYQLGNNVLSLDYSKGKTDINTVDASLIKSFSDVQTESYRLAYEIHKDTHTTFGWSFSLPSHVTSGSMDLEVAESVNLDGTINYTNINSDLTQSTKEKNIGFYYSKKAENTLDAGINFTAEYRMDKSGVANNHGVEMAVKMVKKFVGSCKFLWMKNPKCFDSNGKMKPEIMSLMNGGNAATFDSHGLVYDIKTDKFIPIDKQK